VQVDYNLSLREHSFIVGLAFSSRDRAQADVQVSLFGAQEHNRQERVMLYGVLLGRALGVPFVDGAEPVYDPKVRMARWRWRVPLADAAPFARVLAPTLDLMARTTYNPESVEGMRDSLRGVHGRIDGVIQALPQTVFERFPWYDSAFLELYPPERAPALVAAVLSAMLAAPDERPNLGPYYESPPARARQWLNQHSTTPGLAEVRRHADGELAGLLDTRLGWRQLTDDE
jgi:hypothetical protein